MMKPTGLLLLCSLFPVACKKDAAAHERVPAPPTTSSADPSTEQSQVPSDLVLAESVRKALLADSGVSVTANSVQVVTRGGVVTLRGQAKDLAQKEAVGALAISVAGKTNVVNLLEVTTR